MRFADSYCTYTEVSSPVHAYVYTGRCIRTKKEVKVTVPAEALYAYRQGVHIQTAMPMLTNGEREFLMSGISQEGWDQLFSDETDNDVHPVAETQDDLDYLLNRIQDKDDDLAT